MHRHSTARLTLPLTLLLAVSLSAMAETGPQPRLTPELIERYSAVLHELLHPDAPAPSAVGSKHGFDSPSALREAARHIDTTLNAAQERRYITVLVQERTKILEHARAQSGAGSEQVDLSSLEAALDRDAPVPEPRYADVADADIATIAPHERELWRLLEAVDANALQKLGLN